MGLVGAERLDRALDSETRSIPLLALRIARTAEEDEFAFLTLGCDHEPGVRFGEAGQIAEVTALTERVVNVAIARHLARRRQDGECVCADRFGQRAATPSVFGTSHSGSVSGPVEIA